MSWLLCNSKNCQCRERLNSVTNDEKNVHKLVNAWKEFRAYIRAIYGSPPIESVKKNLSALDELPKLRELFQWYVIINIFIE